MGAGLLDEEETGFDESNEIIWKHIETYGNI